MIWSFLGELMDLRDHLGLLPGSDGKQVGGNHTLWMLQVDSLQTRDESNSRFEECSYHD